MFVWKLALCAGGDPLRLANMAQAAGFSWVAIKAVDGTWNFNQGSPPWWGGPNLLPAAVAALRALDIKVYGWQYIYGKVGLVEQAAAEADKAIENIQRFDFDAWFIDAEHQYKRSGAAVWANTYMNRLRAGCPDVSLGLCSYRFPTLHPELPWAEFLRRSDFHAPQVYWIGATNSGAQLRRSVRELTALRNLPVVPLGCAYAEDDWRPTVGQINEFNMVARLERPY